MAKKESLNNLIKIGLDVKDKEILSDVIERNLNEGEVIRARLDDLLVQSGIIELEKVEKIPDKKIEVELKPEAIVEEEIELDELFVKALEKAKEITDIEKSEKEEEDGEIEADSKEDDVDLDEPDMASDEEDFSDDVENDESDIQDDERDGRQNDEKELIDSAIDAYNNFSDELLKEVINENVYETKWIELKDLSNNIITDNDNEVITHNLNEDASKINITVFIKAGEDEVAMPYNQIEDGYGIAIKHINNNKVFIVTADKGVKWTSIHNGKIKELFSDKFNGKIYCKIVFEKQINITDLLSKIKENQPRGIAMLPATTYGSTGTSTSIDPEDLFRQDVIGMTISSSNGDPFTTGLKGYKPIAYNANIKSWTILTNSEAAGSSVTFNVKKATTSTYPVFSDVITDPDKRPTILESYKQYSNDMTGWQYALSEGDILAFYVDSINTLSSATLLLLIEKV